MPERGEGGESYSNPIAPPGLNVPSNESHHPMTNDDFRKLIMTPRAAPQATPTPAKEETYRKPTAEDDDKGDQRRKKKMFYASLKKQEEDKLAELAEKYRDRARERREGVNPDYQNEDPISSTAGYRAVAPDAKSGLDAAERRRQMIQESKFLGGDMEHTHLVKGLDYALLQKVRSEISNKEKEDEELEQTLTRHSKDEPQEEEMEFKTVMGRNIYRQIFRPRAVERNDLFLPNRMAYVIELDDEYADSDIPTTLIRSKKDCPNLESHTTLTTNDIVINKLTQILSYLRQGMHNRKGKKKGKVTDKPTGPSKVAPDDAIFEDAGDYVPEASTEGKHASRREGERDRDRKRSSYFEKPSLEDERAATRSSGGSGSGHRSHDTRWSSASDAAAVAQQREDSGRLKAKLTSKLERDLPESYAECYPGAPENEDAVADSDDEVDYTKMDLGNKKGPIGRWDFDTQEEYSEYMSHKEALPKAAFQYGVKMADGRKTRRAAGKKDDKAKLDRELQKINQIIARRKAEGDTFVGLATPEYKRPKF
ncbi:protein Red [Dermacentor andersoni]|uniref:protein Red n=1 Tax=Dermacentor andersoni TaxID=34620 RepID=UPI002155D5E3|nr:protein Red-like [Dermacentor andersoni]